MRKYEPKYPLENLGGFYYPNLLKDSHNVVLSENITYFVSADLGQKDAVMLEEMEAIVKRDCANAYVAYHDSSGNRWIFLVLDKIQTEPVLKRMQEVYVKLYNKVNLHKPS